MSRYSKLTSQFTNVLRYDPSTLCLQSAIMKVVFCLVLLVAAVTCQDFSNDFFLSQGQPIIMMMPNGRNSRGPVVFPVSPEGTETSGVIIGASGYGFVPPGSQRN